MKKTLVLFCFIASMQTAFAQSTDSLFLKYSAAKSDSLRYEAILAVYKTYSEGDPLIFLKASEKFLAYCQTNKDKIGESLATSTIGFCYRGLGNTTRSLEYSIKGFEIGIETGNEISLAVAKAILAHCYKDTRE